MSTLENKSSNWQAVKTLFDEAMALDASQREAHVRARVAADSMDASVAAEVLHLLAHATTTDSGSGFLSSPASPWSQSASRIGQTLGAWALVRELGAGGMGEVFLAQRADGSYMGQAAVKVLKRGMDSASVLARFDLERQSLARLDHPHIARLLDAGLTPDGLPYFVMEHVSGVAIDVAVEQRSVPQRLSLFLQLADAVAHAHRNLLVHRDLKPSNVLVNDQGQVKLLDFGIAKAIDPSQPGLDQTRESERPYTPSYASPEQVRGDPVTTATDIYSLGVLLYVMLTGAKPYARHATSPHDMAQAVLNDAPTKPSSLSAQSALATGWEQTRKRLAGDLDTIVLKALAKPIEQRYASVDAFANDIKAHLSGHPISARPQSWRYLSGRFISRNKLGVALAGAAMATLIGGSAALAWQAKQTDLARARAEARFADVRKLVNQMVFKYHDEIAELSGAAKAREELLKDALTYIDSLYQDAKSDPGLAREVAEVYLRLGVLQGERFSPSQERVTEAARNVDRAISLLPLYAQAPTATALELSSASEMWRLRADLLGFEAKLGPAMEALKVATQYAERMTQLQPNDQDSIARQATLLGRLGGITGSSLTVSNMGRISEAMALIQRSRDLFERASNINPNEVEYVHQWAWGEHQLATASVINGKFEQALRHGRKAIALRDLAFSKRPDSVHMQHQTATARANVAGILMHSNNRAEAFAMMDSAEAIFGQILAKDPNSRTGTRDLTFARYSRARIHATLGECAQALPLLRVSLQMITEMAKSTSDRYMHAWHADNLTWLSRCELAAGHAQVALAYADQSKARLGADTIETQDAARAWGRAQAMGAQAAAMRALGRSTESVATAKLASAQWLAVPGASVTPEPIKRWRVQTEDLASGG